MRDEGFSRSQATFVTHDTKRFAAAVMVKRDQTSGADIVIDTPEMRNLPWHIMQRRLAEAAVAPGSYATLRRQTQPHWRYMPSTGFWLNGTRKGVGESTPRP
jgi:hypothetical protein